MRTKRITTLMLSGLMALSTVGLTATAVSADYDEHAGILYQVVLRAENIAATNNNWRKANQAVHMTRDIRHFHRDHRTPRLVKRTKCTSEFYDWLSDARFYGRQSFLFHRGKATNFREYPAGWQRQQVRIRQMLVHNRAEDRYNDSQDDLLDCVFDALPRRVRHLIG